MKFSDLKAALEVATPLEKSLPTGVRGLRSASPYTAEQIQGAAQMALAHGAIDAESAATIQSALNLAGPVGVPAALLAKLRGE